MEEGGSIGRVARNVALQGKEAIDPGLLGKGMKHSPNLRRKEMWSGSDPEVREVVWPGPMGEWGVARVWPVM